MISLRVKCLGEIRVSISPCVFTLTPRHGTTNDKIGLRRVSAGLNALHE